MAAQVAFSRWVIVWVRVPVDIFSFIDQRLDGFSLLGEDEVVECWEENEGFCR